MTHTSCDAVLQLINAVRRGCLDELTSGDVDALAMHLNDCARCAALISGDIPDPQTLSDPLRTLPAPGDADRQWAAISKALDGQTGHVVSLRKPRRLAVWSSVSAAAVLLLSVTAWQLWPQTADLWSLDLAGQGDVDIQSVEVYGDAHLMLMNLDDENGISVIWVTDD